MSELAHDRRAVVAAESMQCPRCDADIGVHRGFVAWCPACEWNINPAESDRSDRVVDRIRERLGNRMSTRLHYSIIRSSSLQPRTTFSKILAYVVATLVHCTTLAFLVVGVALPILAWPNVLAVVGGVLALAIAWVMRPRLGTAPTNLLDRESHPRIYALVDSISDALGKPRLDGVAVNEDFNAYYIRVGFRRRQFVSIGLPMFAALDPQERVSLLGHEIGHGVNGDSNRGVYIGSAVDALARWHVIWLPDSIASSESGLPGIIMIPINAVLYVLAGAAYGGAYLLQMLLYRDSQRAEYYADHIAALVAGTDAAVSDLAKSALEPTYQFALQVAALNPERVGLFEEFRRQIERVPDSELERVRRVQLMNGQRIDATHPPTALRLEAQQLRFVDRPLVSISADESRAIDDELAQDYDGIARVAIDQYRSSLYN